MKNIAIILAGGTGTRMNSNIPKQYIKVFNKPILIYTLEKFEQNQYIDDIYIVSHVDWINKTRCYLKEFNITKVKDIIVGGNTAQNSIYNALHYVINNLNLQKDDVIIFHESVRPKVSQEIINSTLEVARTNGNGISCGRPYEYYLQSSDGIKAECCYHRDVLYSGMNPQAATLDTCIKIQEIIKKLNSSRIDIGHSFIDFLVYANMTMYIAKGDINNTKITTQDDLKMFENYLSIKK